MEVGCTRDQPRKKRGPLNRYVQSRERAKTTSSLSIPPTPRSPKTCGLDLLGPSEAIAQIIDDWFQLIHSVSPILHRATFLQRLADGDATRDVEFSNLVISICAATIASLRRKSSAYHEVITVRRCMELIASTESGAPRQQFTLEWCQMKYNLSVAFFSERGMDSPESFHLMFEAVAGVRYLIYYGRPQLPFPTQQLLKRLYWLLFAGQCTLGIAGRQFLNLLAPSDNLEALTPLEITDLELYPSLPASTPSWHGDKMSYIPGLNHLVNLFMIWYQSQQEYAINLSRLQHYVELVHSALDHLPPELRWRGGLSRPPKSNFGTDVQTVNLYITQIHIRSSLLEQMDRLATEQGAAATLAEIVKERQRIIDDMLAIVYQMPEETLEANGHSLVPKLRDIGLALLRESPDTGTTLVNLDRLLAKLERLDFRPGMRQDQTSPSSV